MLELIFVLFMIFFAIAAFSKQPWGLLLYIVAFAVVLVLIVVIVRSSGKPDFILLYLSYAACFFGVETGFLINLVRAGLPQFSFNQASKYRGLSVAMSVFWLMYGAGALGYAWASNTAVSYAQGEDAWTLYNKGNEGVAATFFFFSLALSGLLANGVGSAITKKGIRFRLGYFVEWKQVESYTWRDHHLTVYLNASPLPRWLRRHSTVVKPADRDEIDRLLAQYLPDKQVLLSPPAQATA